MEIVNKSDRKVTWFCFNADDAEQEISHQHDDLRAKAKAIFTPVALDGNAMFYVLFTSQEAAARVPAHSPRGRDHLGGGRVSRDGTITYSGTATTGDWAKAETSRQAN
jgi:hypothetical protein